MYFKNLNTGIIFTTLMTKSEEELKRRVKKLAKSSTFRKLRS